MKSIVIMALLGEISAIQLRELQQARFIPSEILSEDGYVNEETAVQANTDINLQSDPITGSLGHPKSLLPEIDVDAVVQNDLRTRSPVNFNPKLDADIPGTHSSLEWAEKNLGKKLTDPEKIDRTKLPLA